MDETLDYKDFEEREQEISDFIDFLSFMEYLEQNRLADGKTQFDSIFHDEGTTHIGISYQALINILKSNASLMIYNLIESSVMNMMEAIYDEIKRKKLSYVSVNEAIQKLWRETYLKSVRDPNSSVNTFYKKNEEIIRYILSGEIIDINARDSVDGGNLDLDVIRKTFSKVNITIHVDPSVFRPDLFKRIKDNRNNLAHGNVSFIEALRQKSIGDIREEYKKVAVFLNGLWDNVEDYITERGYLAADKRTIL